MDIRRRMLFKKKASSSGGGGSTAGGSYTVNLNSQWEATTAVTNPDSTLYDGVYRSVSNYNVNNGVATMYITIKDCSSFKMYIRSYAESNYDYVMVSQLDKTITGSSSYSDTTLVKAHTRGNQQSGTALSSYTLVEFTGISSGEHTITVVYRKDSSVNSGDDRGYVLIEKTQESPETPEEPETGGTTNLINVGDVAYWNGNSIKTTPVDKWDISLGTAIGVVVIPNGFAPDGKVRIIGLKSMDENGNMVDSNQEFYWSSALIDTSLTNYTTVPITDNKSSDSTGSKQYSGYLPSDRFDTESYVDPIAGYGGGSTQTYIPSPYITRDGEFKPNSEYYKELSGGNMLSDFNGLINTQTLVRLGSDYKAANACWNYKDGSSSNIQWYLPAMGELGYLMARFNAINETITLLDGVVVDDNIYYSSSEQSTDGAMYLVTSDGNVYASMKNISRCVRAFAMVEIDNSINTDNYLTIEARENRLTASLSTNECEYCVNGDGNWKSLAAGTATENINSGQTLSFRGELTPNSLNGIGTFSISKKCNLKGNCMSMLFGDNASNNYSLSGKNYAFYKLFQNCTNIVNISENFLPATTLASYCYHTMFNDCTSLTTAPELPATKLASYCYQYMFQKCTNLTTAPELPATTLASYCYHTMFNDCTSLTTAPELPATKLASYCYQYMFQKCTNLTTAPELPATTLASYCYSDMFSGCTSLKTAPVLPATTLKDYCYNYMFSGCKSLTTAPELPATKLVYCCYRCMFNNCTSLTTAPDLPVTTLAEGCYISMFSGCSKLNYIKMLATDISASDCLSSWVKGVAGTGTFVKNPAMTTLPTGLHGIPSGWTVVNDGEIL